VLIAEDDVMVHEVDDGLNRAQPGSMAPNRDQATFVSRSVSQYRLPRRNTKHRPAGPPTGVWAAARGLGIGKAAVGDHEVR